MQSQGKHREKQRQTERGRMSEESHPDYRQLGSGRGQNRVLGQAGEFSIGVGGSGSERCFCGLRVESSIVFFRDCE